MADIKKEQIFIGTPAFGGNVTAEYANSLLNLGLDLYNEGYEFHVGFVKDALVTRARDNLAHAFVNETGNTHLLFIDADICFDSRDVIRMIKEDKDIVVGAYPRKYIDWSSIEAAVQNNVPYQNLKYYASQYALNIETNGKNVSYFESGNDKPVIEVKDSGTGFMLIKRNVFEKLQKITPRYINNTEWPGQETYSYFETVIDPKTNLLLSEDYAFCKKWRDIGGKIHLAPYVSLQHVGPHTFG
jgi:hypothetical protein